MIVSVVCLTVGVSLNMCDEKEKTNLGESGALFVLDLGKILRKEPRLSWWLLRKHLLSCLHAATDFESSAHIDPPNLVDDLGRYENRAY